jgi:alpha-D-ribose 1-methylphosphonate 5-triphosphate synthase subunit PhnH
MTHLSPGFADPVLDAQASFRAILEAMSRPGRIQHIKARITPPAPLCTAAAAALLSLADADTPLWLDAGDVVAEWLRFHCGAPITPEIGAARFALACGTAPSLEVLDVGTDEDPQLGATLILQVAGLVAGDGWRLTCACLARPLILPPPGRVTTRCFRAALMCCFALAIASRPCRAASR